MQKIYQNLFCDLQDCKSLVFHGETDVNGNWLNGFLFNQANEKIAQVINSIVVWGCNDPWTEDYWVEFDSYLAPFGFDHTTQVNRQWRNNSLMSDYFQLQMKYLSKENVIILEIAAGPGGGFAPMILKHNPQAKLIFNDIGLWILEEWQKLKNQVSVPVYLGKEHGEIILSKEIWTNTAYARFDFNYPPLKAGSIDCISSLCGLTNVVNWNHSIAVIHKLLRIGGLLVIYDFEIPEECLQPLTVENKKQIYEMHKKIEMEFDPQYYEADFKVKDIIENNGFEILEFGYGREIENDGSNGDYIPKLFTDMGIKFKFKEFHLVARKI